MPVYRHQIRFVLSAGIEPQENTMEQHPAMAARDFSGDRFAKIMSMHAGELQIHEILFTVQLPIKA